MFFVRADQWWYSKIPPPLMLLMALLSGAASALSVLLSLGAVIVIISLVANFGYVLNEIFDVEEDAKVNKSNVAALAGAQRLWIIAGVCIIGSSAVAYFATGPIGLGLTVCALLFPLAYSVPPLRLKERKWLGVLADALAAHVYPVLLCLLIAAPRAPHVVSSPLIAAVLGWSLMFGLRGILTHQIIDDERDRASGQATVVNLHGVEAVIRLVKCVVAPIEVVCLAFMLLQVEIGPVFWSMVAAYVVYEALKVTMHWNGIVFFHQEQPYIPFLNNAFYEIWGPCAVAIDIAMSDARLWFLPLALVALFWQRFATEAKMVGALAHGIVRPLRSGPASRRKQ
jgi:4-hydroxybenzoate polyprenyltransferase